MGNFESENLQKMYVPFEIENTDFEIKHYGGEFEVVVWNYIVHSAYTFGSNVQIYGYNRFIHGRYHAEIKFGGTGKDSYKNKLANVTYFYNYDDCPNEGYYWVYSWDETLIDYIPPEPTREGYTFGGWYKEPECVNEWNFGTDITHKEIILADFSEKEIRENYEDWSTSLYAKWIAA